MEAPVWRLEPLIKLIVYFDTHISDLDSRDKRKTRGFPRRRSN